MAKCTAGKVSAILLPLLIKCFGKTEDPLVFVIDETVERRPGAKFKAKKVSLR